MRLLKPLHKICSFARLLDENAVAAYSAQAAFFMTISLSPFMLLLQGNWQLWTAVPALWAVSRCVRAVNKGLKKIKPCESKQSLISRIIIALAVSITGWFFLIEYAKYGSLVAVMLWLYTCMFVFLAGVQLNSIIKHKKP
jgi:uncharacterized BrkB/YihY/UPF0761 family membrane protein